MYYIQNFRGLLWATAMAKALSLVIKFFYCGFRNIHSLGSASQSRRSGNLKLCWMKMTQVSTVKVAYLGTALLRLSTRNMAKKSEIRPHSA